MTYIYPSKLKEVYRGYYNQHAAKESPLVAPFAAILLRALCKCGPTICDRTDALA